MDSVFISQSLSFFVGALTSIAFALAINTRF